MVFDYSTQLNLSSDDMKDLYSTEAYCVKCRTKKEMKNPKAVTMKNKKPASTGTCPTCGTRMFRIGKSK
jgi:hypothetical protein